MKEVKKNPLLVLINILIVDSAAVILAFIILLITNYFFVHEGKNYYLNLKTLIIILHVQIFVFFWFFLSWYFETYQITKNSIIHKNGIIFKKNTSYPIKNLKQIEINQGPLGSLFNFGTITLNTKLKGKGIKLDYFPAPRHYVKYIHSLQKKTDTAINNNYRKTNNINIDKLIADLENNQVEFKASFRWDYKFRRVNKALEKAVIKTIAGFMNSDGGYLILGIQDDRIIGGLKEDYESLPKKDRDGFGNHFNQVFAKMIGSELRQFLSLSFYKKDNKDLCLINVTPSYVPVYVKEGNKKENFYVRTGNTTTDMSLREATSYIYHHWK